MKPADLKATCEQAVAETVALGYPPKQATALLATPQGWRPPSKFPRGYLLQVKENGDRIWSFRADRVLAWINTNAAELGIA